MTSRKLITNTWKALKGTYQKLGDVEVKKVVALFMVFFLGYYAIEGFGRTVITEFMIPQELQKDLAGVDGAALTQQLIVELQSIRAVQEAAGDLKVNLVRGLEYLNLRGDPLEINLSGRINTDYKSIIESVGTLKWGPLQIPAALLLRPFQKAIRQKVMQPSIQRLGDSYCILAISDSGGVWQVMEEEMAKAGIIGGTHSDKLSKLIRGIAYKIAFLDGIGYQPLESWVGFYHFHEGTRHLLDYYGRGESSAKDAVAKLEKAEQAFEEAIRCNPKDDKSHYNSILTSFERSLYMEGTDRIELHQKVLQKIKALYQRDISSRSSLQNLFVVSYLLLAEAYFEEGCYPEAISAYKGPLTLFKDNADLKAYILNNIGAAYERLGKSSLAIDYFQEALDINPHYARAYLNLGDVLIEMGDFASGEGRYADAIERRPGYVDSYYKLGKLYVDIQARQAFEKLDDDLRRCLQVQAIVSLEKYISALEGEKVTRNLSEDEKVRIFNAKGWLELIGPASINAEAKGFLPRFGHCLAKEQ